MNRLLSTACRRLALGTALTAAALHSAGAANPHGILAVGGPPAGFDAVHATDSTLAAYALPPRPDALRTPDSYAKWARAMAVRGQRVVAPVTETNIYHGPVRRVTASQNAVANTTTYDSDNWSGVVNTNTLTKYSTTRSFYYELSDYVIPTASNATCDGGWDYSSAWNGIDGWNSGDVLQAGTEQDAYCSSGSTTTFYSAWIEWYPYSESRISLPVSPGDDMFVEVWNTSSTTGYAYLENLNTGTTAEYELTPPSGTTLVGNSAEWVMERPGVGGGLSTLAAYALDYQSGAAAYNFSGKEYLPGSASSFLVDMQNNGTTISAANLLGTSALEAIYQ